MGCLRPLKTVIAICLRALKIVWAHLNEEFGRRSEGLPRLDNSKWELMNRVLGSLDHAFALRTKILGYYNERSYGAILVMVIAFIGRLNPRSFKSKSFGNG